jgi:vacuolar protein sorting-associated protein 16
MSTKPTANWDRVGNHFYRKVQLYTEIFDQDLELENYTIAGAPYSGAVGMRRMT